MPGSRWDEIAESYDNVTGDNLDPATSALLALTPPVEGLRVLDAATGGGRLARLLARAGATVTGVDTSAVLLSRAIQREQHRPLGIRYECLDISGPDCLSGEPFDGVTCNFGLSDIDRLDAALATVARIITPGGWFVFSILHPCFPGWPSAGAPSSWPPGRGYFAEGLWFADNAGFRRSAGSNHRTLATYLNALARHSLLVEEVTEPLPPAEWTATTPDAEPVPVFLAVRCSLR